MGRGLGAATDTWRRSTRPATTASAASTSTSPNTGPAVSKTLSARVQRTAEIQRVGDLVVTELAIRDGMCVGAHAVHTPTGASVPIAAKATILATGGLTRLYARNSASINMGGDGYALALRAGAELIDMEFVQFFPIGHLAPRLVGMDPIMWDPFRYKLGGRLSEMKEFLPEEGRYISARDVATHGILKEVAAGRGSPHGGAWLSFQHCSEPLREAFGPVIDRLAANGIDPTRQPIEVAPIAHYHMGGMRAGADMRTTVPHLFAAGEAVGGANAPIACPETRSPKPSPGRAGSAPRHSPPKSRCRRSRRHQGFLPTEARSTRRPRSCGCRSS